MRVQKVGPALLLLVMLATWVSSITAEIPRIINYQGKLTDSTGVPVEDGDYTIQFKIWSDSVGGLTKWTSQPEQVLVTNGLFNYQLGSVENIPPSTFEDTSLWLGITVGTGPEIPELEPRTRLVTVPYAFRAWKTDYAEFADTAGVALTSTGGGDIRVLEDRTPQSLAGFEGPELVLKSITIPANTLGHFLRVSALVQAINAGGTSEIQFSLYINGHYVNRVGGQFVSAYRAFDCTAFRLHEDAGFQPWIAVGPDDWNPEQRDLTSLFYLDTSQPNTVEIRVDRISGTSTWTVSAYEMVIEYVVE
jgi:hypothetical protein